MRTFFLALALLSTSCVAAPKPTTAPTPADVVINKMQSAWDEVKTFKAKFKQEVFSKQLGGEPDTSEGTLAISKPSLLRWESETEGTLSLVTDKDLTVVKKGLRKGTVTVDIYKKRKQAFIPKSLSFLTGKGKFKALYKYELIEENDKSAKLKLTPKDVPKGETGESYIAEINKDSYLLRALTTETVDTRVVTSFTEIEVNPKLGSELFQYKPQPTDIIHRQ